MKRTISIKLKVTEDVHQALVALQKIFSQGCNLVAEIADREKVSNRVRLHHLCYALLREELPNLGSQMACNAVRKVAHALKALRGGALKLQRDKYLAHRRRLQCNGSQVEFALNYKL